MTVPFRRRCSSWGATREVQRDACSPKRGIDVTSAHALFRVEREVRAALAGATASKPAHRSTISDVAAKEVGFIVPFYLVRQSSSDPQRVRDASFPAALLNGLRVPSAWAGETQCSAAADPGP